MQRHTADPGPVTQSAPSITLIQERTESRYLVGPTDLVERIAGAERPGDVVRIADRVARVDGQVTLNRKIVRRVETPVALLRSSIDTAFQFEGDDVYANVFGAVYEWENASDAPAEMRIVVPRPQTMGSLSGFRLSIGALDVVDADAGGKSYSWTGTVPPRTRIAASVAYRTEGSRSYRYEPGTARLGGLEFRTRGDRTPVVAKAGLAPRDLNATAATWSLGDLQTRAPIAFAFPARTYAEFAWERAFAFSPLALIVFVVGALGLRSARAPLATLAFGVGLLGMAVLVPYLTPIGAVWTGAGVAGAAGGTALGRPRGLFVGVVAALLAAAPALIGNATLAVWTVGLLALGPILRIRTEAPRRSPAYLA